MNNHEQLHRLTEIVNTDPVDDILKSFTTYMYENSERYLAQKIPTHPRTVNRIHSTRNGLTSISFSKKLAVV